MRQLAYRHGNLILLGFVERIDDVYRRSRAALSPADGTGTKMKVSAALAAGLSVFASPQSREGLSPGHGGAVFPITPEAVAALLGSEERRREACACALRHDARLRTAGDAAAALDLLRDLVTDNLSRHP